MANIPKESLFIVMSAHPDLGVYLNVRPKRKQYDIN